MRFGIDYDGTVANTHIAKVSWIKDNLRIDIPVEKTRRPICVPIIGLDTYERMCEEVYGRELTLKAPEIPGAIQALKAISRKGPVYIISGRSKKRLEFSKEWLESKNVLKYITGFETVTNPERTKQQICQALNLGVMVDDELRYLVENEMANLRKILLETGNSSLEIPEGVEVARNWQEVLQLI